MNPKQNSHLRRVARAGGTLSTGILASRILGLVRDVARAYLLGTGLAADAWVIAYRLPNLLRAFFAEGSLSAAFVPVLSESIETRPREDVWKLLNAVLSTLFLVLIGVAVVAIALAPQIVPMLAPGFGKVAGKRDLTIWLTRATFPYLILIGLATLCMGTLNAFHHFRAPAMAPGVMNLFMIGALLGLCPVLGEDPTVQVKGLAAGVLAGGLAQIALQLPPLIRLGYRPKFAPSLRDPDVRRIGVLMLPGLVGIGISEINALVDGILASLLETGSVASLEYGMRLMHLPLGVIGVALGTALLPTLSRQAVAGEIDALRDTYSFALRIILFLMTPAALALILLPNEMVRLLFERGAFEAATSTAMTTRAVAFYAMGLLFYGAVKVTVPVFFSFKDTRTPVKCAAAALISNICLNLLLMGPLKLAGLALATAISAGLNIALLTVALRRRLGRIGGRAIIATFLRVIVGGLLMTGAVLITSRLLSSAGLPDNLIGRLAHVFVPLTAGLTAYIAHAHFVRSPEWAFLKDAAHRKESR